MYIYIYIYTHTHIHIYIYIEREREREQNVLSTAIMLYYINSIMYVCIFVYIYVYICIEREREREQNVLSTAVDTALVLDLLREVHVYMYVCMCAFERSLAPLCPGHHPVSPDPSPSAAYRVSLSVCEVARQSKQICMYVCIQI